jgi:hypothetical protein
MPTPDSVLQALEGAGHTPDSLYRELMSASTARLPGVQVVALPGQRLPMPGNGDDVLVLVRVALGEPGLGCLGALANARLAPPGQLRAQGLDVEDGPAGGYAVVADALPSRSPRARLITDAGGAVPPGQLLLRILREDAAPPPSPGAIESFDGAGDAAGAFQDDAAPECEGVPLDAAAEVELSDQEAEGVEEAEVAEADPVWMDLAEQTGTALPFDGIPEHVPDLTFVVEARTADDRFIQAANAYHANCGLRPAPIRSLEHLVTLLSTTSTRIGRLRIVTHAHPEAMAVRMFEGSDLFQVNKEWLSGFADDDIQGLRSILGFRAHLTSWSLPHIVSHVRRTNADLLDPFGFKSSAPPSVGPFQRFLFCCADIALVNMGRVTQNGAALPAAERATLLGVLLMLSDLVGASLVKGKVTATDLANLRNVVSVMTPADLRMTTVPSFDFPASGPLNPIRIAGGALAAIRKDFRTKLTAVKKRFDATSFIDIRGCRVGDTADYLEAVRDFFGLAGRAPSVSGPRWFQYFGECPARRPATNADIRGLFSGGAGPATRAAFDEWARRARVDPSHKDFWSDLARGNVVEFCQLAWRGKLPALPLKAPGLTELAALSFKAVIPRIRELFDVPAGSTPSGGALNALDAFVTTKLAAWVPHLRAPADKATPQQRKDLHQALRKVDGDLGQALVPATAPSPTAAEIARYQTDLVDFLERYQLAPVRRFLTAIKGRLDDTADPGLHYYMLQIGLPVFLFGAQEAVTAGHAVNTANNHIVVLDGRADAAYRQWPPLLWAEALPAGNRFGTLRLADAQSTNFAMMVEAANPGRSQVASCPHPDYMDKIRTVR